MNNVYVQNNNFPKTLNYTDSTQEIYYLLNLAELSSNDNLTVKCSHELFPVVNQTKFVSIEIYEHIQIFRIVYDVLQVISLILIIILIVRIYIVSFELNTSNVLIKFIPTIAAQSNPIFKKITQKEFFSSKTVDEFLDNMKKFPELNFFVIFYYENDVITNVCGDFNQFFANENVPQNISELLNLLLENFPLKNEEIKNLFENKSENVPLTLRGGNGVKDIVIFFSKNPDSFIIKDDSVHAQL